MKPSIKGVEMSKEEKEAMMAKARENEALAQRAKIALSFMSAMLQGGTELSDEEIVEKATRLAESAMEKLLGITFTPDEA